MDKGLTLMGDMLDKFISSYEPSPTLSQEQNLSVWFEQNKEYLQKLDRKLTKDEKESLKNVNNFLQSIDFNKIRWAMSWPEGQEWRSDTHDNKMPMNCNWSVSDTFIQLFEWLDKHTNVDDPYIQFLLPGIKEKSEKNPAELYALKKIGFTFQEILILIAYFWRKDKLEELRQTNKKDKEQSP